MMKKTAIALQYPDNAPAPFIVFKGNGDKVERMLKIAEENNIPIVCEPETAFVLSFHEVGSCVPAETYEVLAGIFSFLKKVKEYDRD